MVSMATMETPTRALRARPASGATRPAVPTIDHEVHDDGLSWARRGPLVAVPTEDV